MADLPTIKKGATWPPLRFRAADEKGLLPIQDALSVAVRLNGRGGNVEGVAEAFDEPDEDGFNGQYVWASGDTTDLDVGKVHSEIIITWAPGKVEIVPGKGGPMFEVTPPLA